MSAGSSLADAFTAEHREIDAGIERFAAGEPGGVPVHEWAAPLLGAMEALRRHIYLEEELVFPAIRHGGLAVAIMVMIREHGELWLRMDGLERMLRREGADEEPSRGEIVEACRQMLSLLDEHNGKEEPVIYPHMDAELDTARAARLREYLEIGSRPEEWVCEGARGR